MAGNSYILQLVDPTWQQYLYTKRGADMQRLNDFIKERK